MPRNRHAGDPERQRADEYEVEELIIDERFRAHIPLPFGRRRVGRMRAADMKLDELGEKLRQADRKRDERLYRRKPWWKRLWAMQQGLRRPGRQNKP